MSAGPSRRVVRLVLLAIALRGVGYAFLTPTYEGWDEYQHLGYFETNSLRLGVAVMPVSVMNDVARNPVPKALKEQAPASWLQTYSEYWERAEPGVDSAAPLYEAQHAPWYYLVHMPFRCVVSDECFGIVRTLRGINVLWVLLGVSCIGAALRGAEVGRRTADSVLILLSIQPLFLMTFTRVANDAMAFALACMGVAAVLRTGSRTRFINAGVLFGLAGAVKATAWTLAPAAAVLSYGRDANRSRLGWFIAFFMGSAGAAIAFDVARQGRFAPTQEAWVLAEQGKGIGDVVRAATTIDWLGEFERRWGRQLLWVGGWSFAPLPKFLPRLHQWLLIASLITLAIRLYRGGPRNRWFASFCVLAFLGVAAGQAIHMGQSKAALGFVATPAWYAVISLPWLFAGLAWSWGVDERLRRIALCVFFALLWLSDFVGVFFVWLPTFADSTSVGIVIDRCSILAGGKAYFVLGAIGFAAGWIAAFCALKATLKPETA